MLNARTAQEAAMIDLMASKLNDLWAAADEILQYDGSYPAGQVTMARAALDSNRTIVINSINSAAFAPGSNKTILAARVATVIELAVASLEGYDLRTVTGLSSREVARQAMSETYAMVSAAVCGRLAI
jgi:hypothetical protein